MHYEPLRSSPTAQYIPGWSGVLSRCEITAQESGPRKMAAYTTYPQNVTPEKWETGYRSNITAVLHSTAKKIPPDFGFTASAKKYRQL